MRSELQRLEQQLASIRAALQKLPEGKLICVRNGNYFKWFRSDGHVNTYIPSKQKELAEQLAIKKFLTLQEKDIMQEQKAIEAYLKRHRPESLSEHLLLNDIGCTQLLAPYFQTLDQELQKWMQASFESNQNHPEHLIHNTPAGFPVRSKSEAIIVMLLQMHHIPFRYECALELDGTVIYPDFTIRHPQNGELYYWEHFGMMDYPNYCKNAFSKLQLYASHGIYPSRQLLTTYETLEDPLDSAEAEAIIRHYFL